MDDLPLEVGVVDDVGVDDPEPADACGGEVERGRRPEPAGADQEDARLEQALLALLADLGDQEVARVACPLRGRQRRPGVVNGNPFRFQSAKPPARLTACS